MNTVEEIYSGMKTAFEEKTGTALADGGDRAVRLYAAAAEIYALYVYNDWLKRQSFPQTAEGDYLDSHGQMRGITRTAASRARGCLLYTSLLPAAGRHGGSGGVSDCGREKLRRCTGGAVYGGRTCVPLGGGCEDTGGIVCVSLTG